MESESATLELSTVLKDSAFSLIFFFRLIILPDDFEPLDFGHVQNDIETKIVYGKGHHLASSSLWNVSGVDSS